MSDTVDLTSVEKVREFLRANLTTEEFDSRQLRIGIGATLSYLENLEQMIGTLIKRDNKRFDEHAQLIRALAEAVAPLIKSEAPNTAAPGAATPVVNLDGDEEVVQRSSVVTKVVPNSTGAPVGPPTVVQTVPANGSKSA